MDRKICGYALILLLIPTLCFAGFKTDTLNVTGESALHGNATTDNSFRGKGDGLTNLNASNHTTGTLPIARGGVSSTNRTEWDTAYSWGNHASAGYAIPNDTVYGASWNGSLEVPTQNSLYDKIDSPYGQSLNNTDNVTFYNITATNNVKAATLISQGQTNLNNDVYIGDSGMLNFNTTSDNGFVAIYSVYNETLRIIDQGGSGTGIVFNWSGIVDEAQYIFPDKNGTIALLDDIVGNDTAYAAGWNGSTEIPTQNSLYDKIETLGAGSAFNGTLVDTPFTLKNSSSSSAIFSRVLGNNQFTIVNKVTAAALVTVVPNMTSSSAPSGLVSGGYDYTIYNYLGGDVYNGNTASYTQYEFAAPQVIDAYNFTAHSGRYPYNFTFEGSDDNSSWAVLDTVTGNGAWNYDKNISNTHAYTQYKLNITEVGGGWGGNNFYTVKMFDRSANYAMADLVSSADAESGVEGNNTFGDILGRTWIKGGWIIIDSNGTQINLTSQLNSTKNMSAPYFYGDGSLLDGMNYFKADVDGKNYNLSNITNLTVYQANFPDKPVTINITPDAAHCIATSEYSASYVAPQAFNSTLPLPGSWENNAWISSNSYAPQSLNVDLDTAQVVNSITYNNGHHGGGVTQQGARNFTFWGSNDSVAFNETAYANTTGWISLNASVTEFDQHSALDAPDNKTFTVTNNTAYRFYCFKIADNWCGIDYIAIRNIKFFYVNPVLGTTINSTDIITKTITLNSNISAPAAGMMQYNATGFYGYNGTAWNKLD